VAPEASARSLPSRVRRNGCAPPPSLRSRGFDLRPRFGGKIPAAPPPPPLVAVGGFVMRACGFRFFFSFFASVGISFRLVAAHLSSGRGEWSSIQLARGPERSAPDADPLPRLLICCRISSRPAPPLIEPDMIPGAPRVNLLSVAAYRGSGQQIDVLTADALLVQWFACIFMCLFIE